MGRVAGEYREAERHARKVTLSMKAMGGQNRNKSASGIQHIDKNTARSCVDCCGQEGRSFRGLGNDGAELRGNGPAAQERKTMGRSKCEAAWP